MDPHVRFFIPDNNSFKFRCIFASQCSKGTALPCDGSNGVRSGAVGVDLRQDDEYSCCHKDDVIVEPVECFDIPNHEYEINKNFVLYLIIKY